MPTHRQVPGLGQTKEGNVARECQTRQTGLLESGVRPCTSSQLSIIFSGDGLWLTLCQDLDDADIPIPGSPPFALPSAAPSAASLCHLLSCHHNHHRRGQLAAPCPCLVIRIPGKQHHLPVADNTAHDDLGSFTSNNTSVSANDHAYDHPTKECPVRDVAYNPDRALWSGTQHFDNGAGGSAHVRKGGTDVMPVDHPAAFSVGLPGV